MYSPEGQILHVPSLWEYCPAVQLSGWAVVVGVVVSVVVAVVVGVVEVGVDVAVVAVVVAVVVGVVLAVWVGVDETGVQPTRRPDRRASKAVLRSPATSSHLDGSMPATPMS